jgi:hypothetical protein
LRIAPVPDFAFFSFTNRNPPAYIYTISSACRKPFSEFVRPAESRQMANNSGSDSSGNESSGSASGDGLHTLVDGLTLSPTSPVTSPISPPSSAPGPSVFNNSSSSIFNNPGSNTVGDESPFLGALAHSNTGSRLQSFSSRTLSYSGGSSSASASGSGSGSATVKASGSSAGRNDSAVKEVDDPTTSSAIWDKTTPPGAFSRLFGTTPQASYNGNVRCYSYRGMPVCPLLF